MDSASAETLHPFFIRDAQGHLFFEGRPVSRAVDARSLVFLGDHFARDSKAVYFVSAFGLKSMGADVPSFRVKGDGQGQDKDLGWDPKLMIIDPDRVRIEFEVSKDMPGQPKAIRSSNDPFFKYDFYVPYPLQ